MRRNAPHAHPCETCGRPVVCDGPLEPNVDGWPAVICATYHRPGSVALVLCEDHDVPEEK